MSDARGAGTGARGEADADARATTRLVESLEVLRARLAGVRLPLDLAGTHAARRELATSLDQLDDYLLPRLRSRAAPLLVVVGGSTGAGKSTLVNSLVGRQVSAQGVLRPTTRAPVLVHHPLDERWFSTDRVLPTLARLTRAPGTPGTAGTAGSGTVGGGPRTPAGDQEPARSLRLVADDAVPQGLALVDAPDVDSVETANRELADQLLAAADLWLFVTTAARYADAVPWGLLRGAAERRAQVALVLDRVDPGAEAVADDLRRLMADHGLADAPLFVVAERELADGLLPEASVAPVATWLTTLGADPGARERVAVATRDGVVADLVRRAGLVAAAADDQAAGDRRLRDAVAHAYGDAARDVDAATSDGALLRGEVLARWQDFVGTSELFRAIEHGVGRLRDVVTSFLRGRPTQAPQVEQAIAHGLESVVLDAADTAAERASAAWRADPAGRALLPGLDLSRSSAGLRADVGAQVRAWQGDVLDVVREQGASRRGTARALSFGVNGLGVSLMVVVFASTGGLTGAEIGIAGGTAVVAQKLLEAVFGDDAVRRLADRARELLGARVRTLLDAEAARYTAQLDALGAADGPAAASGLRDAARAVEAAARDERAARRAAPPVTAPASRGPGLRGAGLDASADDGEGRADRGAGREPSARAAADAGSVAGGGGFWRRLLGRRAGDVAPDTHEDASAAPDAAPAEPGTGAAPDEPGAGA